MKKKIIISLSIIILISVFIMCYFMFFNKKDNEIKKVEESNTIIESVEVIEEMEEIQNDIKTEIVEDNENIIDSSSNDNIVSNKNNKKSNTTSSSNVAVKNNNSKVKEEKKNEVTSDVKEEVIPKEEKEEKTSELVNDVKEEPKETSIEDDPIYIRMKKELFSSISECNNKGMELNLQDMENIASTMCSSESYKGVEVGFRLYIRYNDGTYKEYKK